MGYSVKVRITSNGGATVYNETIATGNDVPGDVVPAYGLADPLTIKQSLPNDPRGIMAHPDPEEATLTLIAPSSTTYADIALGDPVAILVYPAVAFAGTAVRFCGRVAGMNSQPHDLGVLITLTCLDYLADLREVPVGQVATWPLESARNRINRITDELGIQHPGLNFTSAAPTFNQQAARGIGEVDAYTAIVDTLDSWVQNIAEDETQTAIAGTIGAMEYRVCMQQNITGADEAGLLFTDQPFVLRIQAVSRNSPLATRRVAYAPPARITNLAGVRTVTVAAADSSPSTGAPILDGARVALPVVFSQAKGQGNANVVRATTGAGTQTFDWRTAVSRAIPVFNLPWWYQGGYPPLPSSGGPQVTQDIPSQLDTTDPGGPTQLIDAYRCPFRPDTRTNWAVGTMSWQAWKEPSNWRRPELTELLTVSNAQVGHLPTNRGWVVGLVAATTLIIAQGRVTFDIDLLPFSYDYELNRQIKGSSLGTISYDSAIIAGVTFAQLSTRDSFNDYMIVRGS